MIKMMIYNLMNKISMNNLHINKDLKFDIY